MEEEKELHWVNMKVKTRVKINPQIFKILDQCFINVAPVCVVFFFSFSFGVRVHGRVHLAACSWEGVGGLREGGGRGGGDYGRVHVAAFPH